MKESLNLLQQASNPTMYQEAKSLAETCYQTQIQNQSVENQTKQLELEVITFSDSKTIKQKNSCILEVFTELIEKYLSKNLKLDGFQRKIKQKQLVKIEQLLKKMFKLLSFYDSFLITAIILLDRLHLTQPDFNLTCQNIYFYVSISLIISVKYCDDTSYSNIQFAQLTKIQGKKLNQLEIEFLTAINFKVYTPFQTYQMYQSKLTNYSRRKKCVKSKSF